MAVTTAAAAMDHSSNVKAFFPALALGAFLLFNDEKEIKSGVIFTAVALVLWGLLAFHHKMSVGTYEIPYEIASGWLSEIVLLTAFAMIAIEAIYFRQILLRYSENYREIAVKAQAANAAKSNFLAAMSHELRTPMNGVLGMSEILSQSKLEPAQEKMVSTIKESSLSLLGIIDDVLDTSQIEAGKMQLHPKPVDLRSHLLGVLDAVQPMADQRNLRIDCEIPDAFDHVYLADDIRLRQILMNIIGNSVKYSVHEDGSTGETVSISLAENDGKVVYTVIDHGVGMSDEMLADLFTPFTQFGYATRRRVGGTGLGLSISKRLIDLMEGQIEVHSTPGEGTWVQLALPLERQAKLDETPIDIDWIARLRSKAPTYGPVLLVEDNAVNRTVIEHQLRGLGLEYSTAEDGQKGLEMWQNGAFDLVLSDIHMPEMNGYDMSRAIRSKEAECGSKPVPIVAITANALQGEAEKCFEAGMDACLSKPVKLNDLAEKLERMLAR